MVVLDKLLGHVGAYVLVRLRLLFLFRFLNPCFIILNIETKRRCGFFLDVFGLPLPEYLECGLFPESTDSEICVGHKEVKDAKLRAQKPGKCLENSSLEKYFL